jgi:MerR family transcriptional regulator, Zn(II)-responsive regulator of zntA
MFTLAVCLHSDIEDSSMVQKAHLLSGELAQLAGVSADTLRHYERMKLLAAPRRSSGNYRLYPRETVDRVRLIRNALAVGFSLHEMAKILKVRDAGGAPCRQVKGLLEEKVEQMNEQIHDLTIMRDYLTTVLSDWHRQLAQANGKPARLLENLTLPARSPRTLRSKRKAI